ncbi:hypothetical protein HDU97_000857 [Phlyctochytrium planicorne]|nr:hypothetical protein HDU97_000857 [Phlyctochytrium planicorne]
MSTRRRGFVRTDDGDAKNARNDEPLDEQGLGISTIGQTKGRGLSSDGFDWGDYSFAEILGSISLGFTLTFLIQSTPDIPFIKSSSTTPPAPAPSSPYKNPIYIASLSISSLATLLVGVNAWNGLTTGNAHGMFYLLSIFLCSPLLLSVFAKSVLDSIRNVDSALEGLENSKYKLKGA